jgi:hypothetical protein
MNKMTHSQNSNLASLTTLPNHFPSDLTESILLLRTIVKFSHLDNQKHLDMTLVNQPDLERYEQALKRVRVAVVLKELTDDELKSHLGLF